MIILTPGALGDNQSLHPLSLTSSHCHTEGSVKNKGPFQKNSSRDILNVLVLSIKLKGLSKPAVEEPRSSLPFK